MIRITGRRWSSEYKELALEGLVARALAQVFAAGSEVVSPAPALPCSADGPADAALSSPASAAGNGSQAAKAERLTFTLNGSPVSVEAPADRSLLDVLRDDLGLTGTKEGCNIGECGACSVLLDGRLVNSCLVLAWQAGGRDVVTIEGVRGADGGPNDLQQAFIDCGAVQCGYCTPGMVLAGEALLAANPQPDRAQIRVGLAGNLCRCTGYQQIVDAIEATALKRENRQVLPVAEEL
jgi:carbon-monoxide dehydrogenase small subunit